MVSNESDPNFLQNYKKSNKNNLALVQYQFSDGNTYEVTYR